MKSILFFLPVLFTLASCVNDPATGKQAMSPELKALVAKVETDATTLAAAVEAAEVQKLTNSLVNAPVAKPVKVVTK